mgnify:CR=1 FL=1
MIHALTPEERNERKTLLDAACAGDAPLLTAEERRRVDHDAALMSLEAVRAYLATRRAHAAATVRTLAPAPVASMPSFAAPQASAPQAGLTEEDLHAAAMMRVDPRKLLPAAKTEETSAGLTEEDLHVAAIMGVDPKKLAAQRGAK